MSAIGTDNGAKETGNVGTLTSASPTTIWQMSREYCAFKRNLHNTNYVYVYPVCDKVDQSQFLKHSIFGVSPLDLILSCIIGYTVLYLSCL